MKSILLFLALSMITAVSGQSAKKVNRQLRAELLVEQQDQDSFHPVFIRSYQKRDSVKKLVYRKLEKMYEARISIRESYDYILMAIKVLNNLDRYPNIDLTQFREFADYTDFADSIRESLKPAEYFDKISYNDQIDGYKWKEQNQLLEERLQVYQEGSQINANRFQKNESAREQLEAISPSLDSLLTLYQLVSKELLLKRQELDKEVELLRENYRLNGPKGFSDAYRRAFPYIHPLPLQEKVIMEESGGHDVEPKAPEPMIERIQVPEIVDIGEPATFPGGHQGLKKYLSDNLVYPPSAKETGISGKVFLKFIVSDKGELSNVKIVRGMANCPECDKEAMRVVKGMPNWIPGKNNGKAVNSYFNLPIVFKL